MAADLGAAFGQASHTLSTLARYEAALERAFYRALHELQRLQALLNQAARRLQITLASLDGRETGTRP